MPMPVEPSQPSPGVTTATTRPTIASRAAALIALRGAPGWNVRALALRLVLAAIYICGWSALSLIHLQTSDLERFYIPAALVALRGQPLFIYSASHLHSYPLANGPLSIAPLVLALAIASGLGWLRSVALTRLTVMAIYSVFPLLLAREAVHTIDRHAPEPLRGARRLLIYEIFAISLQLWQSMLYYGHVEQPMMLWLALMAIRALGEDKPRRAGALLGLALLTRTTALTVIIPVGVLLLARRHWRSLRWVAVALSMVVAGGLLPFALADGRDLLYSLVTFHNSVPVNGGNLWTLVGGAPLTQLAQRADGVIVLAATTLAATLVVWRRPDLRVTSRDFYGALALGALCHPAFINILWPYYFLEAYTFLMIWRLAALGELAHKATRWRWLLWLAAPLGVTMLGQARQFALAREAATASITAPDVVAWGWLTCLALAALLVALAWRLMRQPAPSEGAMASV